MFRAAATSIGSHNYTLFSTAGKSRKKVMHIKVKYVDRFIDTKTKNPLPKNKDKGF
jgi:hypothetical protein